MPLKREKVSELNRRHIIGMSGGRCTKCRGIVFCENEFGEKARLGDDAHIIAASDTGPRGNSKLTSKERAASDNLLLLCKTCHTEIDQQPKKYSVSVLIKMREEHYSWVEESMHGVSYFTAS